MKAIFGPVLFHLLLFCAAPTFGKFFSGFKVWLPRIYLTFYPLLCFCLNFILPFAKVSGSSQSQQSPVTVLFRQSWNGPCLWFVSLTPATKLRSTMSWCGWGMAKPSVWQKEIRRVEAACALHPSSMKITGLLSPATWAKTSQLRPQSHWMSHVGPFKYLSLKKVNYYDIMDGNISLLVPTKMFYRYLGGIPLTPVIPRILLKC